MLFNFSLRGLQQRFAVAHLPNSTLSHDFPYGVHGINDFESSNRHTADSLVSIRQPISVPQQILGPKHVPKPEAHFRHYLFSKI